MIRIPIQEVEARLKDILVRLSFGEEKATIIAGIFTGNSCDGVYSHGLNRFPVFVKLVKEGWVKPEAEPFLTEMKGAVETWDGGYGAGTYNAHLMMNRAIDLSMENGIGMVSLVNTNHWMRGGTYGWQAAGKGCIGICTTNTIANMPPWGGKSPRLGNNPLVIAVPRKEGPVVVDMALSQYSYGALNEYIRSGKELPVPGGYDKDDNLSYNPSEIYENRRVLPVGFWKGSALSLVIDCLLTALGGGRSVKQISEGQTETGLSQLFISIHRDEYHEELVKQLIAYTKTSEPVKGHSIRYPGENTLITRKENTELGIPVHEDIWKEIESL